MSRAPSGRGSLLTANDVALLCRVDLKTIHNWSNKGKIPHFRTDGRHLRFRRLDVIDFLRAYELPVPESLTAARAKVCIVDADVTVLAAARRALGRRFDLVLFADAIEALVSLDRAGADVVVLDDFPWLEAARVVERLRAIAATRHLRFVVYSARVDRREIALRAGALDLVPKGDLQQLRAALERATGALANARVSAPPDTP